MNGGGNESKKEGEGRRPNMPPREGVLLGSGGGCVPGSSHRCEGMANPASRGTHIKSSWEHT